MNVRMRNNLLHDLILNYVLDKNRNKVWLSENDSSYMHSLGMLQGALMAFQLDFNETEDAVNIVTQKGNLLFIFDKQKLQIQKSERRRVDD